MFLNNDYVCFMKVTKKPFQISLERLCIKILFFLFRKLLHPLKEVSFVAQSPFHVDNHYRHR
jgi:hypothetical protein